jgi:hypothetical protein
MADSNFRGPITSMGSLEDTNAASTGTTTVVSIQPLDGPSILYQGWSIADPRGAPFPKDGFRPGQVAVFAGVGDIYSVDAVPQAASTTALAAAQVITALAPMALATVAVTNFSAGAASIGVAVPIIPQGTTVVVTPIALDFGFATGTTIANSTAVQVSNTAQFTQGQWLVMPGVGNVGGTLALFTQVQTTLNATTIAVSPTPATALGVPIGAGNLFGGQFLPPGTQFGPANVTPTAHQGRTVAGFAKIANPRELLARNLSVTASASTAGTATILVTGYDVWNAPMTELITALGTTTAFGKKAFKFVSSVVPQTIGTTVSATYTIGMGDTFGFPVRVDEWQYIQAFVGSTAVSNNVGITTAVLTSPATNTTGDVRGTIQISPLGAGGGVSAGNVATSNNVVRLVVIQNMPPEQLINATPNNTVPMFGVTQA